VYSTLQLLVLCMFWGLLECVGVKAGCGFLDIVPNYLHNFIVEMTLSRYHTIYIAHCKKGIVISRSHLLSEFQVSEHFTCMDS